MEKMNNSQLLSYAGFAAMVLGLMVGYIKLPFIGGQSLLFNMGTLGKMAGILYLISIVGIAVTVYAGYVTFKTRKCFMSAVYASAACFIILVIVYFILRSKFTSSAGDFGDMVGAFFGMGIAPWMYLIGAGCYYFADRMKPVDGAVDEMVKPE